MTDNPQRIQQPTYSLCPDCLAFYLWGRAHDCEVEAEGEIRGRFDRPREQSIWKVIPYETDEEKLGKIIAKHLIKQRAEGACGSPVQSLSDVSSMHPSRVYWRSNRWEYWDVAEGRWRDGYFDPAGEAAFRAAAEEELKKLRGQKMLDGEALRIAKLLKFLDKRLKEGE